MNFLTLSPWSLMPRVNRIPSVSTVTRSLRQKAHEASWVPRATAFGAFSPTVQVENLRAEKSNAPVRTAMHPIRMMTAPIHTASQSSFFQRFEILLLMGYYYSSLRAPSLMTTS